MIRILDNLTINKIAAGEVIEKPVNVVKELVENAIDAGATNISVEIKGGGIEYIRVTDDGCGIPYDDVPTAFLRHATSKIVSSEDLFFLNTLGFRGEALASIASVSHTEMITKTKDEVMGTKVSLDCGSVIEMLKTGAPEGTTIIVKDLFFNVPARKKFLNSPSSEATRIIEMMEEIVLSNPGISFQLLVNGTVKIQTNGSGNLKDVIFKIFGKEVHDQVIPVDFEDDYIKIYGFIGKPDICRPSRSGENYFINGRYVKNDSVTRGIEEGYRNFLMQHKFPFVVLFIELDPFGIDVNVHPAKSEVRITNGEFLVEILNKIINKALTENELIPSAFRVKEDKAPLERAPEPFEKQLIKGDHVIQKGYDPTLNKSISETEAENDKSKEFSIEFEDKDNKSKPNNEFMNHITTISYKSKYEKFEERMKNGDEEEIAESEVSDNTDSNANDKADAPSAEADKASENKIIKSDDSAYDFLRNDTTKEAPKSTIVTNEAKFNRTDSFSQTDKDFKEGEALADSDTSSQGTSLIQNRFPGGHFETPEDYLDKDNMKGSALLKNRIANEEKKESDDSKSQGTSLYKNDDVEKVGAVSEEVSEGNVKDNDNVTDSQTENASQNSEGLNDEAGEEVAKEPAKLFEEWLNSIENKEEEELEKENKGLIVKINKSSGKKSEEKEEANDAFSEFDLEKKTEIIDQIGEEAEDDEDRLKDTDKKFSVLNDDINPVKSDIQEDRKESKFTFRVKDFDKDDDDEELSPVKENVDSLFKKVDRFKGAGKREVKVKETQSVLFTDKTFDTSKLSKFTVIDQIFDTYWLILVENELLIMDQHAAHEKVLYEKFMERFRNNSIETQTLMLSQVVNLSKTEMDVYTRYKKEFEKFGFIINDFGDRDLFIRGIPADLFGTDAKSLFLEILSELINVSPSLHIDIIESRIATRACKAAIKGNQKITKDECHKLIEYMLTLKNPYQCPHGRPTLIRITKTDLEKMFKRIVS